MRSLPVSDPGIPDVGSATRFLLWMAGTQWAQLAGASGLATVRLTSQALMPATIGLAIDAGLTGRDLGALVWWAGALLVLGLIQGASGVIEHRFGVYNWLAAAYRVIQLVTRQASDLGATLPKRLATGEVISVGTSDIEHIGGTMDIIARFIGSIVAVIVIAVMLLRTSVPLGLVVVLGVPALMAIVGLLIKPMHRRQQVYRDQQGTLTTKAGDIVAGLRVLRGIGGESVFGGRYREESQALRRAGVRVARVESVMEASQVLLPGILIALVTWLGARFAVRGDISVGQLISFYGYVVFLIHPLRMFTSGLARFTRGHVAARRVIRVLSLEPELADPLRRPETLPTVDGSLVDPASGVVIDPGRLTAIASALPEDAAAIADRLGRYTDSEATLDRVPLRDLDRATVRELILVADNDARLFSGPLRRELDPAGRRSDVDIMAALHTASGEDILVALPEQLDAYVAERGREFSGGQQQRLRLARALLAGHPVLILVEPTSAVDAHTEARIAARLAAARVGRTTVVCTTSPLVLDRTDHVIYVEDGKVVAEGPHRKLLADEPRYRATVTRGEDD